MAEVNSPDSGRRWRCGAPTAAVLNITATGTQAAGDVTVFPCGEPAPNASNLNFGVGETIANAVTSKLGVDGKVCLYTSAPTYLIVDLNGVPG